LSARLMKLPPSNHPDQLKNILEALAQVKGLPAITAEQMLNREMRNLAWETTVVLITAVPTEGLLAVLKRFQQAGRKVALILIGAGSVSLRTGGLLTYHVSEEVYQKNLEALTLKPDSL